MDAQLKSDLDNALQCLLETYQISFEFGDDGKKNFL